MIALKKFTLKLKQITLNTHWVRFNYVVLGACFTALVLVCCVPDAVPSFVPKHLRSYIQFPQDYKILEKQLSETDLKKLIFKVEHLNSQAEVVNWDKYRPVNSETTIIVIHVHKDVERLQYLVISLAQVKYIWQVLLVFSHSYYDDVINSLVKSITFCRVMQIFYPYSLQLYPNQFPGFDSDDCNTTCSAAPINSCFKRDARRTQHKHHWWWTANYIFHGEWRSDKRITIFLREDDYVLPDLLQMLQMMRHVLPYFPAVEVMSFGGLHHTHLNYDLLMIDSWAPSYDNGLAFNLSTWQKISARSSFYCFYDDCSWSYSMVPVFGNFSGGVAETVACSVPRVLSTSEFSSGRRGARWARSSTRRAHLFPAVVRAALTVGEQGRVRRSWRPAPRTDGGWGDLRDRILCLDPLMIATTEATIAQHISSLHT